MIDMLLYDGDAFAVPAFRIIALIEGDITTNCNRTALAAAYRDFEANYGEAANVTSYHFAKHSGKIRWINPDLEKDGRAFFERPTIDYGEGVRRYGYVLSDFKEPALPYFGVEQRSDIFFFEIDIPADDANIVGFADRITEHLTATDLISGVMGMGFFLPPYKSSLEFELAQATARYRTAIDISPSMVKNGVTREGSAYRWKTGEQPGLADIGWRTLIGKAFFDRLPETIDRLDGTDKISIASSEKVLAITAGPDPIWGEVIREEDITAYQRVAKHLAPLRFPEGCARRFMFGGNADYEPRIADKLEAYLNRFSFGE